MKNLLALFLLFLGIAAAADLSGTWKGSAETPNGTIERTFIFKQVGATLSGETSSEMFGKSTIENGKVDGDNVSFTITVKFEDNEMKLNYTGKVDGGSIKLHAEGSNGISVDYVAKKVS